MLDQIEAVCAALADNPQRGSYPAELVGRGKNTYRELYFKPYRVIYQIKGGTVVIAMIADGRRDLVNLLEQRLFRS